MLSTNANDFILQMFRDYYLKYFFLFSNMIISKQGIYTNFVHNLVTLEYNLAQSHLKWKNRPIWQHSSYLNYLYLGVIIICVFTVLYYLPPDYLNYYPFLCYPLLNESILIITQNIVWFFLSRCLIRTYKTHVLV